MLRVDDGGDGGIPVVFVHGLAGDRTQWSAQLQYLRPARRAIAIDLRGHGESDLAWSGDYSIQALASDVAAVAERLRLERFVLVGHSLGGAVAGAYSAHNAKRVAGLLLVDPSGDLTRVPRGEADAVLRRMRPATYSKFMREYFGHLLAGASEDVRSRVMKTMRRTRREAVVGCFRGGLAYDPIPALRAYRGPVLCVVSASNREPISLPVVLPRLPRTVMTGTSHWPMMDRPDEFDAILEAFLAKVDRAAGQGVATGPAGASQPSER